MGRRKIEIKAIKDDRNRSVTFLKRKGGLFKKAHELSVLCSVDVAVIIFGHNKKLYEFSSGDINETIGRYQYYGQPHEHKGPADYRDKNGGDSDDDDEDLSPPRDEAMQQQQGPPPQPHYPPQMPQHPYAQQIRHPAPSASPPVPQGMFQPRHGTPQPHPGSRPSSRNDARRLSSNLVPMHPHATPPPPQQNGFAYVPNPGMYQQSNPNVPRPMPAQATPPPQYQHFPHHPPPQPYQAPPPHLQSHPPPPPPPPSAAAPAAAVAAAPPPPPPPPHQLQQSHPAYPEEQRRHPMPSTSESSERQHLQAVSVSQPPQHQSSQQPRRTPEPERPLPVIKTDHEESSHGGQISRLNSKSRSIFTPIDDRGSVLAQLFGFIEPRDEGKQERPATAQTIPKSKGPSPQNSVNQVQRTQSMPMPDIVPPSRTNTNSSKGVGRGPRLKVQIPSEASDAESPADENSPRQSVVAEATPAKGSSGSNRSSGVVLPPPSPSASAILSAGATGPPNPFARPPPRDANLQNHNAYGGNNNIDTPISALPSRFVADNLLPSPSSFYPDWGFGRSGPDSNMLPSPLTFPTPIKENAPGFGKENNAVDAATTGEKRKGSMDGTSESKKLKA